MNVFCCQTNIAWEDKPANFARARALLDGASIPRGSLVLLPEMFATGFSMNVAAIAEDSPGETEAFLSECARKLGVYLQGGFVARGADGKGQNKAAIFAPDGSALARYQKIYTFTLAGETAHYSRGPNAPVFFAWNGFTVAPFICYDLRFPELFRAASARGAQLYTVIANWPQPRDAHWIALLRARAIENQAYVAGVNRCGDDPKYRYLGRSIIVDPLGNILADAGEGEGVVGAALDLKPLLDYRRDFPALADRMDS